MGADAKGAVAKGGEFDIIETLFAPLSVGAPSSHGLKDDVARLFDSDFIVTKDVLVEGVHFRKTDPLELVARKALRVNLSDLAAKSARPLGYFLGLVWPKGTSREKIAGFASGLAQDQDTFKITLLGGDTTMHVEAKAPLTISVTMIGKGPSAPIARRDGAKPGDDVYVTGTIGDSGLGLITLEKKPGAAPDKMPVKDKAHFKTAYQLPEPRIAVGGALSGLASSAIDVSDGLLADAGHLSHQSKVKLMIEAHRIPLSDETARWVERQPSTIDALARLGAMGDDYEILFTAPASRRRSVEMAGQVTRTRVSKIGTVTRGEGVTLLNEDGKPASVDAAGYDHFSSR